MKMKIITFSAIIIITIAVFCAVFYVKNMLDDSRDVFKGNKQYPSHPELSDCENLTFNGFCIDDVAEINNNITLCNEINDPEIRTFCIARISLNYTMCEDVLDDGLKNACIESIDMKNNWSNSS